MFHRKNKIKFEKIICASHYKVPNVLYLLTYFNSMHCSLGVYWAGPIKISVASLRNGPYLPTNLPPLTC